MSQHRGVHVYNSLTHECVCGFVCIMRMREYVFKLSMPIALRRLALVGTNSIQRLAVRTPQHTFLPLHGIIYGLEFSNEYSFHSKYLQTPTPIVLMHVRFVLYGMHAHESGERQKESCTTLTHTLSLCESVICNNEYAIMTDLISYCTTSSCCCCYCPLLRRLIQNCSCSCSAVDGYVKTYLYIL